MTTRVPGTCICHVCMTMTMTLFFNYYWKKVPTCSLPGHQVYIS